MPATATEPTAAIDEASPPLLRVDRLGVRFGRQEVLRDISIDLATGDTLVVLVRAAAARPSS